MLDLKHLLRVFLFTIGFSYASAELPSTLDPDKFQIDLSIEEGSTRSLKLHFRNLSEAKIVLNKELLESLRVNLMTLVPKEKYEAGKIVPVTGRDVTVRIPPEMLFQNQGTMILENGLEVQAKSSYLSMIPMKLLSENIDLTKWLNEDEIARLVESKSKISARLEMDISKKLANNNEIKSPIRIYSERIYVFTVPQLLESSNIPTPLASPIPK